MHTEQWLQLNVQHSCVSRKWLLLVFASVDTWLLLMRVQCKCMFFLVLCDKLTLSFCCHHIFLKCSQLVRLEHRVGVLLPVVLVLEEIYLVFLILYEFQEFFTVTPSKTGTSQILELLVVLRLQIFCSSISLNTRGRIITWHVVFFYSV